MINLILRLNTLLMLVLVTACQMTKQAPAPVEGYDNLDIKQPEYAAPPAERLLQPQPRISKPTITVTPIATAPVIVKSPVPVVPKPKPTIPVAAIYDAPIQKSSYEKNSHKTPDFIIVKSGDGLGRIAEKYQIPTKHIIELNNLQPPYNLLIDQKLWLKDNPTKVKKATLKLETRQSDNKKTSNKQADVKNNANSRLAPHKDHNVDRRVQKPQAITAPALKADKTVHKNAKPALNLSPEINDSAFSLPAADTPPINPNEMPEVETVAPETTAVEVKKVDKLNLKVGQPKFSWPIHGKILKKFGTLDTGFQNDGINIEAREGEDIAAVADGVVAYVGNEIQGFGNLVMIKHHSDWMSAYAHCAKALVKRGDKIKRGTKIASIGHTGNVRHPQLHFELRQKTKAVDPLQYLE